MTQPAYLHIKPYIDNGDSNADIAEDLSYVTQAPIAAKDVRELLIEEGLWYENPIGWSGALQVAFTDDTLPAAPSTQKALELLWQTAFLGAKDDLQTTTQLRRNGVAKNFQPAARFVKALGRLVDRDIPDTHPPEQYMTQTQADDILALGGGLLYPDGVTEAEVAQAIADKVDQDAKDVLQVYAAELGQRVTAAAALTIDAGGATEASVLAAAIAELQV